MLSVIQNEEAYPANAVFLHVIIYAPQLAVGPPCHARPLAEGLERGEADTIPDGMPEHQQV